MTSVVMVVFIFIFLLTIEHTYNQTMLALNLQSRKNDLRRGHEQHTYKPNTVGTKPTGK